MSAEGTHAPPLLRRLFYPSLGDCVIAALTIWLVAMTLLSPEGGLLMDASTGLHIRTGQHVLEHASVPHADPFSFTKAGQPWFAWEWLCDVLFAFVFNAVGLKGIVVMSAAILALTAYVVVRYCLWSGADALSTLVLFQLWVGSSSIHFLARPHIFTLLFMVIALWLVDRDRRSPTHLIWLLIPLTAIWVNLHGGFVGLIVSLLVIAGGSAIEAVLGFRSWEAAKRYLLVAGGCLAASLANPYGIQEHRHLAAYLSAGWIREMVEEFQSPRFHRGEAIYYELFLVGGLLVVTRLLARREIAKALLVLAWAHASVTSARHIPIFAIVCAPVLAVELKILRDKWISSGPWEWLPKIFASLGADHVPALSKASIWAVVPVIVLLLWPFPADRFALPESKFPLALIEQKGAMISNARVFTLDSWADYLTYRYYPRQRIFVDGRSDFFGKELSEQYLQVLNGQRGWDTVLRRYGVNLVLVPEQSSVATLLRLRTDWTLIEQTDGAALFQLNADEEGEAKQASLQR